MARWPCDPVAIDTLFAQEPVIPVPPPPDPNISNAAGWFLLVFVIALAVYELWAIWTGGETISEWIKGKTKGLRWWKAFGVVSIGLLLWHLFEGGPL